MKSVTYPPELLPTPDEGQGAEVHFTFNDRPYVVRGDGKTFMEINGKLYSSDLPTGYYEIVGSLRMP